MVHHNTGWDSSTIESPETLGILGTLLGPVSHIPFELALIRVDDVPNFPFSGISFLVPWRVPPKKTNMESENDGC